MKQKIFKVFFNIRVACNGIYKFIPTSITVMAETEEEAKSIFKSSVKFEPDIQEVKEKKI